MKCRAAHACSVQRWSESTIYNKGRERHGTWNDGAGYVQLNALIGLVAEDGWAYFLQEDGVMYRRPATYDRDGKELVGLVTATVDGRPYPDFPVFERM